MNADLRAVVVAWMRTVRNHLQLLPQNLRRWQQQVRDDPRLILQSPTVRAVLIAVGVGAAVLVVLGLIHAATPTLPGGPGRPATTGSFQVQCTNEACNYRWTITRDLEFDGWPVTCPRCGQKSGYRLLRCPNPDCGRWVVPLVEPSGRRKCPKCGTVW